MERDVEAVEPDVSKAEARDPEWPDDESRCLEDLSSKNVFAPSFLLLNLMIIFSSCSLSLWQKNPNKCCSQSLNFFPNMFKPAEVVAKASMLCKLHHNVHLQQIYYHLWVITVTKITLKTSQELRMLSSVTINCQVLNDWLNSGSQLSEL